MFRNTSLLTGLLLIGLPMSLQAQAVEATQRASATAQQHAAVAFPGNDETAVQARQHAAAAFETALSAGIPLSLIESKIAEGKAKGVDPVRIGAVLQQRADALVRAQAALQAAGRSEPSVAELGAAAAALGAGVSEAAIGAAMGAAQAAGVEAQGAVAIAVLAVLYGEGVLPQQALAQVEFALAQRGDALAALQFGAGNRPDHAGPPAGVGVGAGAGVGVGVPGLGVSVGARGAAGSSGRARGGRP